MLLLFALQAVDLLESQLREIEIASMAKVWAYPEDMPIIVQVGGWVGDWGSAYVAGRCMVQGHRPGLASSGWVSGWVGNEAMSR